MIKKINYFSFLFLFLMSAVQMYGQTVEIKGKVTGISDGIALPGVSVLVKDSKIGTTTDFNGMYTINVPKGSELVFSYIGYVTQAILINQQKTVNVNLAADIMGLDEVVIVGYGSQRKSDVTGATSSLGKESFNAGPVVSPAQMIQGRVSGVQVTLNSGEPGAGSTIRIRGSSSIRSNQDPLYVIDGVPLNISGDTPSAIGVAGINASASKDPLSFLSPNDIENITILKDASATAIYGSRGSNGVILVTTKKGSGGIERLSYSSYISVSELPKKLDLLNKKDFLDAGSDYDLELIDLGANTDWQNQIYRTAITQSHNLSYSGGNEKSNYYASFGYFDQEGIIKGSGLKKFTGKINASKKLLNDKLSVSTDISVSRTDDQRVPLGETGGYEGDLLISALRANPTFPVYENGTYFQYSPTYRNPVAMIDLTNDHTFSDRFLGNFSATYEILEGLKYKLNFGIDNLTMSRETSQNKELTYLVNGGQASISNITQNNKLIENYITYDKQIDDDNQFSALLGHSYQIFDNKGSSLEVNGFLVNGIDYIDNLGYGDKDNANVSSYKSQNELQSFFTRINYAYKNKYLLTATARADGSTKFGENNKYGYFPSVGSAWRLIEEDFIKDLGFFDNLKLRLGWGLTGNQEIPNKISLLAIGTSANANYFFDGINLSTGTTFLRTPNPDIKWETTTQSNIGIDFGFYDGRLSGSIDYFDKSTKDVLLLLTSLAPSPTSTVWSNVPNMRIKNSGFEVDLNGIIINKENLSWNANLNFTTVNNEVSDLPVDLIQTGTASGAGLSGTRVQVIKNGYPIGTFWGKQFLGYATDGTSLYKKDADGKDVEENLGSALPKFTLSLNNKFTVGKFDISMFINGVFGNKVYNNTANALFSVPSFSKGNNVIAEVITTSEGIDNTPEYSSRFIEDGSFIRLSNATVGYNFNLMEMRTIKSLRFYVTGSNLFLITDYSGYDPEVNTNGSYEGVPSLGMDYTSYPTARTFQVGVNVEF